jgi:D-arabinose 1-dehydrogenase-like Zn-dependent alcohol dehydrogenase
MHAVVLRHFGGPGNLKSESREEPRPGRGEVLVRVRACGVCYHDVIARRGGIPGMPLPAVLGHEIAGEVLDIGEGVAGFSRGDRVATLQRMSCGECTYCTGGRPSLCKIDRRFFGEEIAGGYATHVVAPARALCHVPASLSWHDAAIACCTTGTAVHVCRTRGRIVRGETVLITGASGGVGLQAIQLCAHDGAKVIAVTSSGSKVRALEDAGAWRVVCTPTLDFAGEVRRVTDGEGVDVALEIVGSATFPQTLKSIRPGGRVVVVGNLDTGAFSLNPGLVIVKELEIIGAYATTRDELDTALRLTAERAVKSRVADVVPLCEASRVHERLDNREITGRVVLAPN